MTNRDLIAFCARTCLYIGIGLCLQVALPLAVMGRSVYIHLLY